MTETPEQRRERLEAAVWKRLTFEACPEPCWTWSNPIRSGCECVIGIVNTIIASDEAAGLVVVPAEPTDAMIEAGRMEMPVQVKYWQEGGTIHAKPVPAHEAVSPAGPYRAMIAAAKE